MATPQNSSLEELITCFFDTVEELGQFLPIGAGNMTAPFRRLLDHEQHMTAVLTRNNQSRLVVDVLAERQTRSHYQREVLLRREADQVVVEYGMLQVDRNRLPAIVNDAIACADRPFGQLVQDLTLTSSVTVEQFWRIEVGAQIAVRTELGIGEVTFGRLVSIEIAGSSAVQALEILMPDQARVLASGAHPA
ncbi:MAG: hypothetical protein WD002_08965 [Pseudomonadales bacterium]